MAIDNADTAWVLARAALVLFMTPGLAFFYGCMVRATSVLNMMTMSFGSMATVGVVWVLWGHGETFASSYAGPVGTCCGHSEVYRGAEHAVGEATVKTHLLRAYQKLGVCDRTSAVLTAHRLGLLDATAG